MNRFGLALIVIFALTGCAQQGANNPVDPNAQLPSTPSAGGGVLSAMRPHADPGMVEKIREEEAAKQAEQQRLAEEAMKAQQAQAGFGSMSNASGSVLPQVSQAPFAPPADQAAAGQMQQPDPNANSGGGNPFPFWPFGGGQQAPAAPQPPPVASYGGYGGAVPPPPPGASPGGLVPPPPAVSVTGSIAPYGQPPVDPYANPYANPYGQPPPQQIAAAAPARPAGGLFGQGGKVSSDTGGDDSSGRSRKLANFVPITPTGMDSRSPYKQRDDLKVLWKGALANSPIQRLMEKDDKIAQDMAKVDVGLPNEATKGTLSASQRQIDAIFKPVVLDKKVAPQVKQLQTDVVQAYYRYLYSYNKFALLRQTVAARKQEVDVASSAAEQQRAAADLAQAQSDAEAAKDDMRAAEQDLSGKVGPQSARVIIGHVSGVTPSAETLAAADSSSQQPVESADKGKGGGGGLLGGLNSMLGFGKGGKKEAKAPEAAEPVKVAADTDASKKDKGKKKVQRTAPSGTDALSPAPESPGNAPPSSAAQVAAAAAPKEPSGSSEIAFELKNVDVTPRKSILKVSIRNQSGANFSFDPDSVAIMEGNRKLSEATVRAEFDTTLVQPHQEVTGTITIFGHPWNDRLSVALSEGGKSIQLRR